MELATCNVMLHMRLVCAGDVFVHVCSLSIAFAIEGLRLKQNIIHACVSASLLELVKKGSTENVWHYTSSGSSRFTP